MKQFFVHKTVAGIYLNNMLVSSLTIVTNPKIAHLY